MSRSGGRVRVGFSLESPESSVCNPGLSSTSMLKLPCAVTRTTPDCGRRAEAFDAGNVTRAVSLEPGACKPFITTAWVAARECNPRLIPCVVAALGSEA